MADTLILHIETATKNCSVALSRGTQSLFSKSVFDEKYTHAESLHLLIEEALSKAKVKATELSAIHVSKGPGSYTGLRIGVSAAKGLAYSLGVPLLALGSLETLVWQAIEKHPGHQYYLPVIDARRTELYVQVFDAFGNALTPVSAELIEEGFFDRYQNKGALIIGDAAEKCALHLGDTFTYDKTALPDARYMQKRGLVLFEKEQFEDEAYFEPFYLKDFIAGKPKAIL